MITKVSNLKKNDYRAVSAFCKEVKRAFGENVHSLRLYGSKAKGTDTHDSDIDIFVVLKQYTVASKERIRDIAFDVNISHEVYISPRVVSLAALKNSAFAMTPFIRRVENESILL